MSVSSVIQAGIEAAFQAAGDLVKDGAVVLKGKQNFDPVSLQMTGDTPSFPVKLVLYKEAVKLKDGVRFVEVKMLLKTSNILDLSNVDTVSVNGKTWNVEEKISGSAYHAILKVTRRADV